MRPGVCASVRPCVCVHARHVPFQDPRLPERRESLAHVVALRAAGVVHPERRFAAREGDLAEWHPDAAGALEVDLAGIGKCVVVGCHRRAPFAGMSRIRFQGTLSIPQSRDTPGGQDGMVGERQARVKSAGASV